ncbi:uncharacterized protein LOC141680460 [Apium graveolens]|uniref:uncharacterized protein LOC141680460 n=1 Tax=Apium graveolens TaxID=4045 RepID=UPI003D7BC9F0
MHRIVRRKIMGNKLTVTLNGKGESFGPQAAEIQSYIGVLARTKPPIWHDSWKCVHDEVKTKIWDCVLMAFVLPPSAKKLVLRSAGQKWREFKSRLTTHYILPYRDQPEMLAYPPADFSFIEKAHWDIFVVDRTSPEFLKCHDEAVGRRMLSVYPHRMSRKGYANLENEWYQSHPDEEEVDRSSTWVLARKDKDEIFLSDIVQKKAEEIEKLKKEVKEGTLKAEGVDDILTLALGKPEHGGRVRGQGVHVKQSIYFDLPRQKKAKTMDEKIQERV